MTEAGATVIPRPAFLDDRDLAAVMDALPDARVVGGAVRDAVAGRRVADVDLATALSPDTVTRALTGAGLRAVPTGIDHGTITAVSGGRGFEVTTLRRDVETDGRHAVVRYTDDWQEDASRRDFTFNAMSMTRDGVVQDFFGGLADLRAGRVRFVGDPATRIAEDFLRVLRFFRFQARYAREYPDPEILDALATAVPGLARLSPERIWAEIKRILAAPEPDGALALMGRLGVLDAVLPPRGPNPPRVGDLSPDPLLRLAALGPIEPGLLTARLRLSWAEHQRLLALWPEAPSEQASDADLRRELAESPPGAVADRARLARRSSALIKRIDAMPIPVFPLQGRDLQASGIEPGPDMGRMLRALRKIWREGGCLASAEALQAELARRERH